MAYAADPTQLTRYADLIVNHALGGGSGIESGDVVRIRGEESAKPLFAELCRAVWSAGGHVLQDYRLDDDGATNLTRDFAATASPEQVGFFPERYYRGLVDEVDHLVVIDCDADPHALKDVAPATLIARQEAMRPLMEWTDTKENAGDYTWTIALYPTEAMAREAKLDIDTYWAQVVAACFLDHEDPKARQREVDAQIAATVAGLGELPIERLHVRGPDADLRLRIGEHRRWLGGGGRNVPSFEVFTSPDWRGTEGWIRFSEPLYTHGNLVTGIELHFADGTLTSATATENEALLTELVAAPNANRVGEFSLTDGRLSRITRFMANTLYDENVGGPQGNTHVAVGKAFHACYAGDPSTVPAEEWERMGFNDSVVHTDIVSTTEREVTATLTDGSERVIYADGRFQLDR